MKRIFLWLVVFSLAAALVYTLRLASKRSESPAEIPAASGGGEETKGEGKRNPKVSTGIAGAVSSASDGRGVAGAAVRLFRKAADGESERRGAFVMPARGPQMAEEKTSFTGRFHFPVPEPGTYFLRAEKEGFAAAETDPFAVEEGSTRIERSLALRRGASLAISASAGGEPLRGAQAALLGERIEPRVAEFDALGNARFADLPPGPFWISLEPAGADPSHHFWDGLKGPPSSPPDLRLAEGEEKKISLALEGENPGRISGGLWVNDAKPAKTYWISFALAEKPKTFALFPITPIAVQTDAGGQFRAEKLRPGKYRVKVQLYPISPVLHEQTAEIGAGGETRLDLFFRAGCVKGRTSSADGAALAQIRVIVKGRDERSSSSAACLTDGEGRFKTDELPAGKYDVTIFFGQGRPYVQEMTLDNGDKDLGEIRFDPKLLKPPKSQ